MKRICLSFDDARWDTCVNALAILNQHKMRATMNVITDWIANPDKYVISKSAIRPITPTQLQEWLLMGNEIALHGSTHRNTVDDLMQNIEDLRSMGFANCDYGFASPESVVTNENVAALGFAELVEQGKIAYVRSGIQIRREGFFYAGLAFLEKCFHCSCLFWFLNKRNIIRQKPALVYPSVAIKSYTTLSEVKYLIDRMNDGESVVLMFHSILGKNDEGYGTDAYYWDKTLFERLCSYLCSQKNIEVVAMKELVACSR